MSILPCRHPLLAGVCTCPRGSGHRTCGRQAPVGTPALAGLVWPGDIDRRHLSMYNSPSGARCWCRFAHLCAKCSRPKPRMRAGISALPRPPPPPHPPPQAHTHISRTCKCWREHACRSSGAPSQNCSASPPPN